MKLQARHLAGAALLVLAACARDPSPAPPKWELAPGGSPGTVPPPAAAPPVTAADVPQAADLHEAARNATQRHAAARPIDPEAARAAARTVRGVRSVVWVDSGNLLVLVDSNARRSHQTIDEICYQLQPLGDTGPVVVNLQSTAARDARQLEILSRGCQLAPGDRDPLQQVRRLDVLDPAVRAQYEAGKQRLQQPKRRRHDSGDRRALEAIPEM